jgi:transcriptional regulatory protein LevR
MEKNVLLRLSVMLESILERKKKKKKKKSVVFTCFTRVGTVSKRVWVIKMLAKEIRVLC